VAAGDSDGVVRLFDRQDPAVQRAIAVGSGVNALAFSPDGTILATASGDGDDSYNPTFGEAALWDVRTGQRITGLTHGASSVSATPFPPDGRRILIVADGKARLMDCALCGSTDRLRELASEQVRRTFTPEERATYLPKGAR